MSSWANHQRVNNTIMTKSESRFYKVIELLELYTQFMTHEVQTLSKKKKRKKDFSPTC